MSGTTSQPGSFAEELLGADGSGLRILALGFAGAVLDTLELIAGPPSTDQPNAFVGTTVSDVSVIAPEGAIPCAVPEPTFCTIPPPP